MDRTHLAVSRQLQGMGCEGYQIGIREAKTGNMMSRHCNQEQILHSVNFFKSMNLNGNDIYIRSATSQGLILIDDLGLGTLEKMDFEGYNPAAIIQTSPQNYQAWIKVYKGELDTELATQAAKILAEKYGADKNSADWRHYGRLAGFTNLKPIYNRPYVLAERCNGKVADQAEALLDQARKTLQSEKNIQSNIYNLSEPNFSKNTNLEPIDPIYYATSQYQKLSKRYGSNFDVSRADYMVASDFIRMGMKDSDIAATIHQTSPNFKSRKIGHIEDYLTRTIEAAHRRFEQQSQTHTPPRGKRR
jgi:hypothetical protein